ncbi:MAG: TIGR03620 family F420-dependent LLM class oxidoreductase [Candidatus Binataceae bacterium]|jgi:probable F420-dependent oxidoreductase
MDIGKISLFTFMDGMSAADSANFARTVERLGYRMIWYPEAWGREPFAHAGYLAAKTDSLILATGIANIWVRDPMTMASAARTIAEMAEGRFVLGVGVSHRSLVADLHGHNYAKPLSYMREYVARMKASLYNAVPPKADPPLVIAAIHPKMLKLASEVARGTQTYLVTPEHTRRAREVLGKDAWVCVGQITVLERDASKARAAARKHLEFYMAQANYIRSLKAQGFSDQDIATVSDHLIDSVIAWGDEDRIRKHFDAHFAAGASQICMMPVSASGVTPDMRAIEAFAPR